MAEKLGNMSVVGATKDLWLIQNVVGFVSITKWHITAQCSMQLEIKNYFTLKFIQMLIVDLSLNDEYQPDLHKA